jgi:hypothetical protein
MNSEAITTLKSQNHCSHVSIIQAKDQSYKTLKNSKTLDVNHDKLKVALMHGMEQKIYHLI